MSVCGASLLSNTRLVTAAHCWFDGTNSGRSLTVVLGTIRLFTDGVRIETRDVETHAGFNSNNLNNDIAMITIDHVDFNDNIQPIRLASGRDHFQGVTAVASGFGETKDNDGITFSQVLSFTTFPVISNVQCIFAFGSKFVIFSTICTSGAEGRGICNGDHGGPLVTTVDGENVLIGIASFGSARSCQSGFPSAYARVTSFQHWIRARL